MLLRVYDQIDSQASGEYQTRCGLGTRFWTSRPSQVARAVVAQLALSPEDDDTEDEDDPSPATQQFGQE